MSSGLESTVPAPFCAPDFVHRFLLTEKPESLLQTPECSLSFEEFIHDLQDNGDIVTSMKRAWRDSVVASLHDGLMGPLQEFLIELHGNIRKLIPKRTDLHSMLSDRDVRESSSTVELHSFVLRAAEALSQLESERRAVTTMQWIQNTSQRTSLFETYVVDAVLYLHYKAELCKADVEQFHFLTRWAPWLQAHGKEIEIDHFQQQFGSLSSPNTAPLTRRWIQELFQQYQPAHATLVSSSDARRDLLRAGWIDTVIFRAKNQETMRLPEIFARDTETLYQVREVTRRAAAGSALSLHACNSTGTPTAVLSQSPQQLSPNVAACRSALVEAMGQKHLSMSLYEENIAKVVIDLAKTWDPSVSLETQVALRGRVKEVLSGTDQVIRLLLGRMKAVFHQLAVSRSSFAVNMRTGVAPSASARENDISIAKSMFEAKGLAFYAENLADAAYAALRVIDLAWSLYGDAFLDELICSLLVAE